MISPERMADIYWMRVKREAAHQVLAILAYYKQSTATVRYWKEVLVHLSEKRGKRS